MQRQKFINLLNKIFLTAMFIIIVFNIKQFYARINKISNNKIPINRKFPGIMAKTLLPLVKNHEIIGYYTDKEIYNNKNNAIFTQAQFILAPTILDYTNLNHELVLINCSKLNIALKKLKELKARPIKIHPAGIILAKRKSL